MKVINIEDVVNAHKGYFFSPNTMKGFHSRLSETAVELEDGRQLFVTSEKREYDQPRLYTVRVREPDTDYIHTLDNLTGYKTSRSAWDALRKYVRENCTDNC
jgi:hypothetical protein